MGARAYSEGCAGSDGFRQLTAGNGQARAGRISGGPSRKKPGGTAAGLWGGSGCQPRVMVSKIKKKDRARTARGNKPWGTRFNEKDAVRKGLSMRFEATADVRYGDDRHWVSGRMGVSEWLLTGTTKDGRKVEVRGSDHYEFRGGKVIRKGSYWKIVK